MKTTEVGEGVGGWVIALCGEWMEDGNKEPGNHGGMAVIALLELAD